MKKALPALAIMGLAGLSLLAVTLPAAAATFTVDDTREGNDANPGDGICATADIPARCTLRAAAEEANSLGGADTVVLPAGKYFTSSCVNFDDTVVMRGAGADRTVIDVVGNDTVLTIGSPGKPVSASVSGITLLGGGGGTAKGGGFFNDAGAQTTLTSCRLVSNAAEQGGGIYNQAGGFLRVESCEIRDNLSTTPALGAFGGGIANYGRLLVVDSTITDNAAIAEGAFAARGGGIYSGGGRLTILRSTIAGNLVFSAAGPASGGGVSAEGTADLLLSGATVRDNAAKSATAEVALGILGGGVHLSDVQAGTIRRTAISGNSVHSVLTAASARGGGIAVVHPGGPSVIRVQEGSSITDNRTNGPRNGGYYRQTAGSLVLAPDTVLTGNLPWR